MERTTITISRKDAISFLGSDGYLSVDKRMLLLFEPNTAIVLTNLIDIYKYLKATEKITGEWFMCSHSHQLGKIKLKEYTLREIKKELKKQKIIEISREGNPSKEWYKIDFIRLFKLLSMENLSPQVNSRTSTEENSRTSPQENSRSLLIVKTEDSKNREKIIIKNEKYLPLAKQLSDIIQTNGSIVHPKTQIQSWANDIRLLSTTSKIPIEEIEKVLDWYEKNVGDKYTPVVLCGSSLRTKFAQLQRAVARASTPDRSSKPSNAFRPEGGFTSKKKAKVVY